MCFTRATYITEEPDAVVPQVRICMGAAQVTGRSTMTASINLDLLAKNTKKSIQELSDIINTLIRCFAQVSPSAKQKTFAAHNHADFVMVTQSDQPLSLANAFRSAIKNKSDVMEESIKSLVNHYEKLVTGYELNSQALAFDMTDSANSEQIKLVDKLSKLVFVD